MALTDGSNPPSGADTKTPGPVTAGGYGPARGEFDPDKFKVDTDTEYDDIDLESYPACFKVEMSGKSMLNGIYRRMPIKCRGRPTYIMQDKKKILYFYASVQGSSKKGCRWVIGAEFGSKKMYARVKEVEDISPPLLPLEPYPHSWSVCFNTGKDGEAAEGNKEKSTEFRQMDGMRVAILHEDDTELPDGELPVVKATFSATASVSEAGTSKRHKHSSPEDSKKRKHSTTKEESASSAAADKEQKKQPSAVSSTSVPAVAPSSSAGKEGAKPAESSDSESESYSSSSAEGSGGSDSDAEPAKPQPPAQKVARTVVPAPTDAAQERAKWRQKLVESMKGVKDDSAKAKKLILLKDVLKKDKDKILKAMPGSSVEDVLGVIASVETEFGLQKPPARANVAPTRKGAAVPTRGQENHRRAAPKAPAIKQGTNRAPRQHRGEVYFNMKETKLEEIISYKGFGEQLWIQQPGFMVQCDRCGNSVEQKQGRLHHSSEKEDGLSPESPGLSLFVQDTFLCAGCSPIPNATEVLEQGFYPGSLPGY